MIFLPFRYKGKSVWSKEAVIISLVLTLIASVFALSQTTKPVDIWVALFLFARLLTAIFIITCILEFTLRKLFK